MATNGEKGTVPDGGNSFFYPWAGQLISRSSYDKEAHWSFFDVGPWGAGHEHSDKLHLSVSAYGKDLLVDSGRFAYSGKWLKNLGHMPWEVKDTIRFL
ncbi:heparinase II/III-family protein [Polaribacter sp. Z014]|uniref:heparinase II/III domain-containing protein n=1 Tax=Polaribacter sp. Z014 TaxID=2927126 RepID=UPI002021779A|nr:heparinase II/III family protein [Polaribacter sp. Z014]MCL7764477.1 heparinase II/III-family protein [Polaribacter sp. Z014]